MGAGETCAGTESLIHLIDDRSVSPWKPYDRLHLIRLNIRSADIPLISVSHPIRIDCGTSTVLHGQVTGISSSCLILMILHTDPLTAVCCAGERLKKITDYTVISHSIPVF